MIPQEVSLQWSCRSKWGRINGIVEGDKAKTAHRGTKKLRYDDIDTDFGFGRLVSKFSHHHCVTSNALDPKLKVNGDALTGAEIAELMAFLSSPTDPKSLNLLHKIPTSVPSGLPVDD